MIDIIGHINREADPDFRERGIGRRMLECGMEEYGVNSLSVNEQNPGALGFQVCDRLKIDGQVRPYPVLYMKRRMNGDAQNDI